jgi:hypothetical protein
MLTAQSVLRDPPCIHLASEPESVVVVNLTVKDVPEDLARRLRERAERNQSSLRPTKPSA